MGYMHSRRDHELQVEGVALDETVEITRPGSNDEFDQFVRQNIIVLDLWAAVANNAVLECLALRIPCLIRKLNGSIECLGD
jgi:hypothetical protein